MKDFLATTAPAITHTVALIARLLREEQVLHRLHSQRALLVNPTRYYLFASVHVMRCCIDCAVGSGQTVDIAGRR